MAEVERKVLAHDAFGLCVCWPRTHWQRVPVPGNATTVLVDGAPLLVTVGTEPCDCQGTGLHEHRFLAFADGAGLARGQRVRIGLLPRIDVRDETAQDVDAIAEVTEAAFRTLAISDHTEHWIVAALRQAGALAVSLVAEEGGRVVGHIAFSRVTVTDGTPGWYGLGPLSVAPDCQRRGIGSALVLHGLARLKALGARGCCVVGHPDYYPRFGFANTPHLGLEGVPAEAFFALAFCGDVPRGVVPFYPVFIAQPPATG